MNLEPAIDTTAVLNYLRFDPPGFVRESSNNLSSLAGHVFTVGDYRVSTTFRDVRINREAVLDTLDPWTSEILTAVAAHRSLEKGWDGKVAPPPSRHALDAAEHLAAVFAYVPAPKRPVFSVDSEGRPSFASYAEDFYLHLTIDELGRVSWYSVKNGVEDFRDDFTVDGFNPEKLASEIMKTA